MKRNKLIYSLAAFGAFILISLFIFIFYMVYLSYSPNKNQNTDSDLPSIKFPYKNLYITGSFDYGKYTGCPIKHIPDLFIENNNNTCLLEANSGDIIEFTLSKPVYIAKMILKLSNNEFNKKKKIVKSLRITGAEKYSIPEDFYYTINTESDTQIIEFSNRQMFFNIFRVEKITLSFDSELSKDSEILPIKSIELIFKNNPDYVPTMPLDEIKSRYVKNRKTWDISSVARYHTIKQMDVEDKLQYLVLLDLSYYALTNKEAESILFSYSPTGAHTGEFRSSVISWFEMNKKATTK